MGNEWCCVGRYQLQLFNDCMWPKLSYLLIWEKEIVQGSSCRHLSCVFGIWIPVTEAEIADTHARLSVKRHLT